VASDALRQQGMPRVGHAWVKFATVAALVMFALSLFLVGLNCLVAGPTGGYAVIVGQAVIVISACLVSVAVQLLGNPRVLRVSRIACALLVVAFLAFESLGPAHGNGYSATGTLVFRAVAEDRYTPADLAHYFRLQLPPSARQLRSLAALSWNGDGQIYFRFDLDPRDVPTVQEQLAGPGAANLHWEVEPIGAPVEWWDIDGLTFQQSTSDQWFQYAIRQRSGQAAVYLVFDSE
jgi:hypothetical protein